jgi:hypothetical protein
MKATCREFGRWGILAVMALSASPGLAEVERPEAAEAPKAEAPPARSAVWGEWPVLPWDEAAAKAGDWSDLLNRPLDLRRKGKTGEQRAYLVRRTNAMLDRNGRLINRTIGEGKVLRTLLKEVEPGLWAERIEWQRFAIAQSQGPNDWPALSEIQEARGLSYEFSPRTFDYVNIPGDFGRIPNFMAGYFMKVLGMDLTGWDAMVLGLRGAVGDAVKIGQAELSRPWQEGIVIGMPSGQAAAGRYQLGEMRVVVAGVTRTLGEPCVLLWVSAEGNEVKQDIGGEQLAMKMLGTEYFRGQLSVSLLDGRVVAGELWGPVVTVIEMGMGGNPPQETPVAAVLQDLSVWEVPVDDGKQGAQ